MSLNNNGNDDDDDMSTSSSSSSTSTELLYVYSSSSSPNENTIVNPLTHQHQHQHQHQHHQQHQYLIEANSQRISSLRPLICLTAPAPLQNRIVILDNDETTGSYTVLFFLFEFLEQSTLNRHLDPAIFVPFLTRKSIELGILRPGIVELLQCVNTMKKQGRIDHIVMYTNQLDERSVIDKTGRGWSIPLLIDAIFGQIIGDDGYEYFDHRITRPTIILPHMLFNGSYPIKDLARAYRTVFSNTPFIPIDLRKTRMIDDQYHLHTIVDSSNSGTDSCSRIAIPQYSKQLPYDTFELLVNELFTLHDTPVDTANNYELIRNTWIARNMNMCTCGTHPEYLQNIHMILEITY